MRWKERSSGISKELTEVLKFTESENKKHREFFQMLYKWTAGSLTIIIVAIGGVIAFVGWHTVEDIRKQAQTATQEEIENIRKQSKATLETQTSNIQLQIGNRLNDEFKTDSIRKTVRDAAKDQTANALLPIITNEVHAQVGATVRQEQTSVRDSLLKEVHASVEQLKPTIDSRVDQTVNQSVNTAVKSSVDAQITPRLQQLENSAQVSTLINQAESGDANAFDILLRMAGDATVTKNVRDLALKVVRSIVAANNQGFSTSRSFKAKLTEDQMLQALADGDPLTRQAAVDSLGAYWKSHLDRLFSVMTTDASVEVRAAAFRQFNGLTQYQGDALDNYSVTVWWREHRAALIR